MKKKLLAFLLTVCLLTGLLSVTALAKASDWDPTISSDDVNGYYQGAGLSESSRTTALLDDGTLSLRAMPILRDGNRVYNASAYCDSTATSSNSAVAEVQVGGIKIGQWQGGTYDGWDCLQVDVTPKAAGTATITIKFLYTFSQNANPLTNTNSVWYGGTKTFTVTVVDPDESKPEKPTAADAERFKNYYSNTSSTRAAICYMCESSASHLSYVDSLNDENVTGGYSFGEVEDNAGTTTFPRNSYPWKCVMTVPHAAWVKYYNDACAAEDGYEHYLTGAESTEVTWYYDLANSKWTCLSANAPIYIDMTHDNPNPSESTKPTQTPNPSQGGNESETTKPTQTPNPSQGGNESETTKPTQTPNPSQGGGESETTKPTQTPNPSQGGNESETTKPTQTPNPSQGGNESETTKPTQTPNPSQGGNESETTKPTPTPSQDNGGATEPTYYPDYSDNGGNGSGNGNGNGGTGNGNNNGTGVDNSDIAPKTGDGYQMTLALLGCAAAVSALFAVSRKRRA